MVKKSLSLTFLQFLCILIMIYLFQFLKTQKTLQHDKANYSFDCSIVLPQEIEFNPYLKKYDYTHLTEKDVLVNGEPTNYTIQVYPYYPEQNLDNKHIYLSKNFKMLSKLQTITIEDQTFNTFNYLDKDTLKIRDLTILIPYTYLDHFNQYCYFIDVSKIDENELTEIGTINISTLSAIQTSKNNLQDNDRTTRLFQFFLGILFIIFELFIEHELIQTINDFILNIRIFGYSNIKILSFKLIPHILFFVLFIPLFKTSYLIFGLTLLIIDFILFYLSLLRKTPSQMLRSK